jgi:Short-chain alcohol dehydrogenase of unknown specificity
MYQVALVTGATRGIGRAIALALGRAGFAVIVTGRTMTAGAGRHDGMDGLPVPGSVEETVAAIAASGGIAMGACLDLLDRSSIDEAIARTMDRFGRLGVLVNNGIYQGPQTQQTMMEVDIADAERATMGNFVNQFHLTREAIKIMTGQGGGRIVFMSTLSSVIPAMGSSGLFYNGPKAAFNRIADYVQFEHAKDGIHAFLIEPRFTMTDTLEATLGEKAKEIGKGTHAHHPDETARTVAWLASHPDAPRFATPQMINAPAFFEEHAISG